MKQMQYQPMWNLVVACDCINKSIYETSTQHQNINLRFDYYKQKSSVLQKTSGQVQAAEDMYMKFTSINKEKEN